MAYVLILLITAITITTFRILYNNGIWGYKVPSIDEGTGSPAPLQALSKEISAGDVLEQASCQPTYIGPVACGLRAGLGISNANDIFFGHCDSVR